MDNSSPEITLSETAYFAPADYAVFDARHRSEALYNEVRATVKEKLLRLHDRLYPEMLRRKWRLSPHWHKGWIISPWYISPQTTSISSMKLRYAKPRALMQRMEKLFQDEFGRFHAHAMLAVSIDDSALGIELFIPSEAWVDGQNLRGKLVGAPDSYDFRRQFCQMVTALGFRARVQIEERTDEGQGAVWGKRARAFESPALLATATALYRPQKHDLRIGTWYRPDDPLLCQTTINREVLDRFEQLYPLYQFVAWDPTNDYRRYAVKRWPRAKGAQGDTRESSTS